jgi:hypothetical protein
VSGKSAFPDISNPRPIRDKAEYIAQTLSVEKPYRYLTGKPTRGLGNEAESLLFYNTDPGEQAYYNIRNRGYDFLEKKGIEFPASEPTEKQNALYYYKRSLVFGDKRAAEKYLKEYYKLGGTRKGMRQTIKNADPLFVVPKKHRREFINSLDAEEKERLIAAQEWYRRVYIYSGKIQ